jgi:phthiocerol/phenolphthiocerol synthesis type-I polyketide synthase C
LLPKNRKIAIVGMACRFPGSAETPEKYWDILKNGRDVVTEIPSKRWSKSAYLHPRKEEPGKSYTFAAGVLSQVEQFDAAFFGISPREAAQMDPQHRLLLELTWEALEDGGQKPEDLAGSQCGVFIGIATSDYSYRFMGDLSAIDAYSMIGNNTSIASNRISYIYDLRGPSLSIDTACSSSLVAIHQACRSLLNGESQTAIAGGINMLLHPFGFIGFSKASMLSPDGRSKAFDESGKGYVRSEGAGIVFLKPLELAEKDGDQVHAIIRASGVNCDGRTTGITVPSSEMQSALIESLYEEANVSANELTYLEAHGTGTSVGDPLEAAALGRTIGQKRSNQNPLPIGSVKTNIGHLETASGIAGLIKAVLALKNRCLPPSLHFNNPNPKIDFAELNLRVVTKCTPLPETEKPLLVGVNSFGFGGANAHVLLEEYPSKRSLSMSIKDRFPPLFLSARNEKALRDLASRYHDVLIKKNAPEFYDLAYTTLMFRQVLPYRLAILGKSKKDAVRQLKYFSDGKETTTVFEQKLVNPRAKLALVFSGNGSQWQGMGHDLLQQEPIFRKTVERIDQLMGHYSGLSLLEELQRQEGNPNLDRTEIAQPLLFAVQVGIVQILSAHGLVFDAVVGHSVGEIAAAWAAGALTLEQATQIIYERSQAQGETRGTGRMAALGVSVEDTRLALNDLGLENLIEISGINSPSSVTVSGPLEVLALLGNRLSEAGKFYRLLDLDYAFHSSHMDSIKRRVKKALKDLRATESQIPYISTVTGGPLSGTDLDAEYWWQNIRKPVLFGKAIDNLIDDGTQVFLEVGPQPILRHYVNECLKHREHPGEVLPTLSRNTTDRNAVLRGIYRAYLAGASLDLKNHFPEKGERVPLPFYPWQREHHWYPTTTEAYDFVERHREHPLLGYRLKGLEMGWENQFDTNLFPYLADHVVDDAVIVPAAAYVEMALAASKSWYGGETHTLENFVILAPIVLDDRHAKTTRFVLDTQDGGFTIQSKDRLTDDPFTLNVKGRLAGKSFRPSTSASNTFLKETRLIDAETHYQLAEEVGLSYGGAFQGIVEVGVKGLEAVARLQIPEKISDDLGDYILHPSLLDSCFQTLIDLFADKVTKGFKSAMIPVQLGRLDLHISAGVTKSVKTTLLKQSPRSVLARFELFDEKGSLVAEIDNCRFRKINFDRATTRSPSVWEFQPFLKPKLDFHVKSAIPDISRLITETAELLDKFEDTLHRAKFHQIVLPLINVMVSGYAWRAIKKFCNDEGLVTEEVDAPYKSLFYRLLAILEEDEIAHQQNGQWYVDLNAVVPDSKDIWLNIIGEYPACISEMMLLGRLEWELARILQGHFDEETLEKWNSSNNWYQLYDVAPSYRAMNLAIKWIVQIIVNQWPHNRRLRILEINAGKHILTHWLQPVLPVQNCDYYVSAVTENGVSDLENHFVENNLLSIGVFDPDTGKHNFEDEDFQAFDLIIAPSSMQQSKDLKKALRHLRQKMTPSGLLLLAERWPDRFSDLTAGLDSHWWHFDDQSKQAFSSLLSPDEWKQALESEGFIDAQSFIEGTAITDSGAFLILAKNHEIAAIEEKETKKTGDDTWLLMLDSGEVSRSVATRLKEHLENQGRKIILLEAGETYLQKADQHIVLNVCEPDHFRQFVSNHRFENIVHLMGLPSALDDSKKGVKPPSDPMREQDLRCTSTLHLLQALEQEDLVPQLWVITLGGVVLPSDGHSDFISFPSQAPLWGLGRVIMNEHPELHCRLIDLQFSHGDNLSQMTGRLGAELLDPENEDEIVLTDEARYALRLSKRTLLSKKTKKNSVVSLDFYTPGPLKNLHWREKETTLLKPTEIEISPHASGLNFRDVMYAMGLLSDEALENGFAGPNLGMELSGIVTSVGSDIDAFTVGDAVMGFAPACFSSAVTTETTAISHKPPRWTHEEAATISTTFFTVYYALHYLARLQPGEKILIHGAAGGVGIAAIQFARYLGAEIFATAGSEEKRTFARLMGADYVMDSRSLAFADEILSITRGEGIDVVLNSISGEAINRNFTVLKSFGRFLELGKRDFYENSKIGLRPFRNNISYFGIDADQLLIERPDLAAQLFREMMELFQEGVLRPLPHRVFPARRVEDAFRYMQESRQIGKVVISFEEGFPNSVGDDFADHLTLSDNGSYLVSGGLSGFGLKTAQWLVSKGARSLVLLGRRGAATDESEATLEKMRSSGVNVRAMACDVTDRSSLGAVFADIEQNLFPLKGVIHAATVFDDGLIRNLDRDRFQKVLGPKILGAWHLHELTQEMKLDFFVMYSSATTHFGNPGQANYIAANYYLEALANYRRQKGLPGSCVAWGAISDVGFLARNESVKEALLSRFGGAPLTSDQALEMLEKILLADATGVAVIDFDWPVVQRVMPAAKSPKYEFQNVLTEHSSAVEGDKNIQDFLASMSQEEIQNHIASLLVKYISQIMRLPTEKISPEQSLLDLGMDSLMGMEIVMSVEKTFGIRLPLMALTEGASIQRIVGKISELLTTTEKTRSKEEEDAEFVTSVGSLHGLALTGKDVKEIFKAVSLDDIEAIS